MKAAFALAVSMTLFLNAALASSAVTLESSNPQPSAGFGLSVAISGTTAVVGAPSETVDEMVDAGHAYVFDAATGDLINTLTSPTVQLDGFFGQSVAISCSTVVVGAPGEPANMKEGAGRAYTFDATSGSPVWTLVSSNPQLGGEFGSSVAISGTTVVVGAPSESAKAGNAFTFEAASGSPVWTLVSPNALADGLFGYSVAVSGTTVVVG